MYWHKATEIVHKILALQPVIPLATILWTIMMALSQCTFLSATEVSDKAQTIVKYDFIRIISVPE